MARYLRAQVNLPYQSGDPGDLSMNRFHFTAGAEWTASHFAEAERRLRQFYNDIHVHLAPTVDPAEAWVDWYDLELPRPRVPIRQVNMGLAGQRAVYSLPNDCALVWSFEGRRESGKRQARRRGRVYLGPFGYVNSGIQDFYRPPAEIFDDLTLAITEFHRTQDNVGVVHCVYSPTNAGGSELPGGQGPPNFANAFTEVRHHWMDNEWDTRRSRGAEPNYRWEVGTSTFTAQP